MNSYVSPHLVRFAERIRLGGVPISEDSLRASLAHCEAVNGGAPITFFEITTAAAFHTFRHEPSDVLVLEVGLGGRLDATNVIARPALTVVAPVSIDHTHYLGETLDLIAAEKAGILKQGVTGVIGRQQRGGRCGHRTCRRRRGCAARTVGPGVVVRSLRLAPGYKGRPR